MKIYLFWIVLLVVDAGPALAQRTKLKPDFDKSEYLELLKIASNQFDSTAFKIAAPQQFKRIYRSPEVGLKNRRSLWIRSDSVAVINVSGIIAATTSWLENFYAAMVPASG